MNGFFDRIARLLSSKRPPKKRALLALKDCLEIYHKLPQSSSKEKYAKALFFKALISPLRHACTEKELQAVSASLDTLRKEIPLKEYRVFRGDDFGNKSWKLRSYVSVKKDEKDTHKKGDKVRPTCDSCGASLVRKGPARRYGWGLYKCEYCDHEYTVKE